MIHLKPGDTSDKNEGWGTRGMSARRKAGVGVYIASLYQTTRKEKDSKEPPKNSSSPLPRNPSFPSPLAEKPSLENVVRQEGPEVADVGHVVHRRPAAVELHPPVEDVFFFFPVSHRPKHLQLVIFGHGRGSPGTEGERSRKGTSGCRASRESSRLEKITTWQARKVSVALRTTARKGRRGRWNRHAGFGQGAFALSIGPVPPTSHSNGSAGGSNPRG